MHTVWERDGVEAWDKLVDRIWGFPDRVQATVRDYSQGVGPVKGLV
jgi:hypothetical protein